MQGIRATESSSWNERSMLEEHSERKTESADGFSEGFVAWEACGKLA